MTAREAGVQAGAALGSAVQVPAWLVIGLQDDLPIAGTVVFVALAFACLWNANRAARLAIEAIVAAIREPGPDVVTSGLAETRPPLSPTAQAIEEASNDDGLTTGLYPRRPKPRP